MTSESVKQNALSVIRLLYLHSLEICNAYALKTEHFETRLLKILHIFPEIFLIEIIAVIISIKYKTIKYKSIKFPFYLFIVVWFNQPDLPWISERI